MKKNQESKRITERENWQLLIKGEGSEENKFWFLKYYHNPEMNQIIEVGKRKQRIILCPIELDFIICHYIVDGDPNEFIKRRLLRVINAMFTNGCNNCPKWVEHHQMLDFIWNDNADKGIIPDSSSFEDMMIDTHYYIYESYDVEDWVEDW